MTRYNELPAGGMTGRSCAVRGQLHVSAEMACEFMHKALPRHEYGGSEFDDPGSDALSAAEADVSEDDGDAQLCKLAD